jgi:hypothetical protein
MISLDAETGRNELMIVSSPCLLRPPAQHFLVDVGSMSNSKYLCFRELPYIQLTAIIS